jgi:protein phosphatase
VTLKLQVAGLSDVGCVRSNNEDCFGYDVSLGIYAVCDGMGGAAAGEVASRIAVDSTLEFFRDNPQNEPASTASLLSQAIRYANQKVLASAAHNRHQRGMGSTIVAVHVHEPGYTVAHVGDSRAYLLRGGNIEQLTTDHSLVMEQLRLGLITPGQAQNSDLQNVITRALGTSPDTRPDLREMRAEPDDTLLLTTDGLTTHIFDEEILSIVKQSPTCAEACSRLISAAREAGGHDNITCLVLRFAESSRID